MADLQELRLQLLGDEKEAIAPVFLQHVLNRGIYFIPQVIQTGLKKGQTLKAHIQNVICFCYQLADILEIGDSEKMNLIAAAYVHDLNKFPEYSGKSYDSISNAENIQNILEPMLKDSDYEFDLDYDLIVSIIRAHSGKYHSDGDSLFAKPRFSDREKLIAAIQTADTLDLSHHFHEQDQKIKALRTLNGQISDYQFEYTWHLFSDNRGIYTNLLQNIVVELYTKQGAVPLLFYPEGVWYLVKKEKPIQVTVRDAVRSLLSKIDRMSLQDTSKLIQEAKGVGLKFTQNPFELGISAEEIVGLWVNKILGTKDITFQNKYENMRSESPKKCVAKYQSWLNASEKRMDKFRKAQNNLEKNLKPSGLTPDFSETDEKFKDLPEKTKQKIMKARNDYESAGKDIEMENNFNSKPLWEEEPKNLFLSELNVLRAGKLVGSLPYLLIEHLGFDSDLAWNLAAETAGISCSNYPELVFFDRQSDRGYRTAVILHENGIGFDAIAQRYTEFLKTIDKFGKKKPENTDQEIEDYISNHLQFKDGNFQTDRYSLKKYIESNHEQCCHCGSGRGSGLSKGNIPQGIKLQYFSNRLKGGGRDPVRNACEICQQNLLIEKLVHESYDNHFYFHFFADGGEYSSHAEPGIFLEALKKGLMSLQSADCRSFFIQPGKLIRELLEKNIQPTLSGEPKKKMGILIPKFSQSIGGQITIGMNSVGDNDSARFVFALSHFLLMARRFNLRGIMTKSSIPPLKADEFNTLFIDHIPLSFKAMIPENNLDSQNAGKLWERLTYLYGLRNTYNLTDDNEITKIARTLYEETGIELFYHLHKSYSESKNTKEYKPWKQAWNYLQPFIQEERLMPIKQLAEIALKNHFHGETWKETSQAKPIDLAFEAISKHREPENEEDLNMVILHDVTRGLERLSSTGNLGKDRYDAVKEFVRIFFFQLFKERYKGDQNRMMKDQRRIRAAFLGYLTVLRDNLKNEKQGGTQ